MGACASKVLRRPKKGEMECLSPIEESSTPKEDTVPDATEPPVTNVGEEKDSSDGKGEEEEEEDGSGGDEEELDKILEELKKSETGKKEWHKDEVKRHSLRILFEENDKSERPKEKHVDVEPSEAVKLETIMKVDNDESPIEEKSSSESKEVEVEMAESNQSAFVTEVIDKSGGSGESESNVMDVKISDESDQKEQPHIDVNEPVTEGKIKPEEGTVEPEEPTSFSVVEEVKEGMENLKDGLKSLIFGHDATVTQQTSDSTLPTDTLVTEEQEVVKDVKIEKNSKEVESSNPAEEPSKN